MGAVRKESIQTLNLSKANVEELLEYQIVMKQAFEKSKSKSEIQKILEVAAIAAVGRALSFSKILAALATSVRLVLDDITTNEVTAIRSTMTYGINGLTALNTLMRTKGYKNVTVKFGILTFVDEGYKVVSSDTYTLVSVDGMN